jgi:hypothetical protein
METDINEEYTGLHPETHTPRESQLPQEPQPSTHHRAFQEGERREMNTTLISRITAFLGPNNPASM